MRYDHETKDFGQFKFNPALVKEMEKIERKKDWIGNVFILFVYALIIAVMAFWAI